MLKLKNYNTTPFLTLKYPDFKQCNWKSVLLQLQLVQGLKLVMRDR